MGEPGRGWPRAAQATSTSTSTKWCPRGGPGEGRAQSSRPSGDIHQHTNRVSATSAPAISTAAPSTGTLGALPRRTATRTWSAQKANNTARSMSHGHRCPATSNRGSLRRPPRAAVLDGLDHEVMRSEQVLAAVAIAVGHDVSGRSRIPRPPPCHPPAAGVGAGPARGHTVVTRAARLSTTIRPHRSVSVRSGAQWSRTDASGHVARRGQRRPEHPRPPSGPERVGLDQRSRVTSASR